MKKALLYFQSGGPTAVINTSFYGVIKQALKEEKVGGIYGSIHGIEGILKDELIDLRKEDPETIELLKQTPAAALGTTRYKLSEDIGDIDYQRILNTCQKHNVGYLLVNGGNDSMDTCHKLALFFAKVGYDCNVIGIPKTIDNDLAFTDHCLGFPSAARYVVQSIQDIALDNLVYSKGKVVIIEVMGRNAGWLTAAAAVISEPHLKPDYIYVPEERFDINEFCERARRVYEEKGSALFVVSEGVEAYLPLENKKRDLFGHVQLGGVSGILAGEIERRYGISTRPIEFSLLQRAGTEYITRVDQEEAIQVSKKAVQAVVSGKTNKMVIIERLEGPTYKVRYCLKELSNIANVEHKLPPELINDMRGNGIKIKEYLLPLIKDTIKLEYKDGRAKYAKLKKYRV